MKIQKNLRGMVILLLTIIGSIELSAQASWKIIDNDYSVLVSGKPYYLQAHYNDFFLKYKSQDYGINLKWGRTDFPNIIFHKSGGLKEINCGDKVAIYVNGGGYLKYKEEKSGMNLEWSKTPVYEWELRSEENKKGAPIRTNSLVGILNLIENKNQGNFMVYYPQKNSPVVNLGWFGGTTDEVKLPSNLNYTSFINCVVKHEEKLLLLQKTVIAPLIR